MRVNVARATSERESIRHSEMRARLVVRPIAAPHFRGVSDRRLVKFPFVLSDPRGEFSRSRLSLLSMSGLRSRACSVKALTKSNIEAPSRNGEFEDGQSFVPSQTIRNLGKTAIPPGVAASEGYAISMVCRKRIEEIFGRTKVIGGLAQLKVRGLDEVKAVFSFGLVAYNLVRLPKLLKPTGELCPARGK